MGKRSEKDWKNKFKCVKKLMSVMDTLGEDDELIECCAKMLRNPVVFDNNVNEVKTLIPFTVGGVSGKITEDHLIGMSNMVLYMFKNGLHKKWKTVDDFKFTLRSLNVLITVTKKMNDSGEFKNWQFNSKNINECINWNKKLKSAGITELMCNETGVKTSVDKVWSDWYEKNKTFLN